MYSNRKLKETNFCLHVEEKSQTDNREKNICAEMSKNLVSNPIKCKQTKQKLYHNNFPRTKTKNLPFSSLKSTRCRTTAKKNENFL